mgnify:CR=1 FL=1
MSIISKVGTTVGTGIAKATNFKPAVKLAERWKKDPEGTLAAATVASIILKDGIGCAMYVTQSMNNKKIPDEKRKFVAALDLTNGVLMIAAQIGMFLAMRKYSGPIFNRLFKKSFNPVAQSNTVSRIRAKAAKANERILRKLGIEKENEKVKKDGLDLFKFIADIAAATIIGKRVIVPLIATPMASKVEKWMEKRDAKKHGQVPLDEVKAEPTMKGAQPKVEVVPEPKDEQGSTNLLEKYKQQH